MNTLLVETSVLIMMGWAATFYLLTRSWLSQRHAWQWWHAQQTTQLHHQAESIRDGLLQQTFAFRRYLETSHTHSETWRDRLQSFYQSLEDLSNQLSPPFVADSLPLALQFIIHDWQKKHPKSPVQLDLPSDWPQNDTEQNQVVLSVVEELLSLLTAEDMSQPLQVSLQSTDSLHTLSLSWQNETQIQTLSGSAEAKYLKEIFHSLTAGRLEMHPSETQVITQLHWRDRRAG